MMLYSVFPFCRWLRLYISLSGADGYAFFFLQKQDYKAALRKYRKALRYLDVCWEKEEIDEGNYKISNTLFSFCYFCHMIHADHEDMSLVTHWHCKLCR